MSEERWGLPIPPEKTDDDFTKMALLFIDTHDELIAAAKAMEHIDIDAVNEWIWKKRQSNLSWVTIKNILRTMQRVLSCCSNDKKPPFSQEGLAIPERDKLQMKIESRGAVSFSWLQAKQIARVCASRFRTMDSSAICFACGFRSAIAPPALSG